MNPFKKKPKTALTLICKFKARNTLAGFFQRNIKLFLTTVNIFFMFFQGILTLEPLPTAICLAYESGIPSACLLVLFITVEDNQEKQKQQHVKQYLQKPDTEVLSLIHAAQPSSKATSCITYSE